MGLFLISCFIVCSICCFPAGFAHISLIPAFVSSPTFGFLILSGHYSPWKTPKQVTAAHRRPARPCTRHASSSHANHTFRPMLTLPTTRRSALVCVAPPPLPGSRRVRRESPVDSPPSRWGCNLSQDGLFSSTLSSIYASFSRVSVALKAVCTFPQARFRSFAASRLFLWCFYVDASQSCVLGSTAQRRLSGRQNVDVSGAKPDWKFTVHGVKRCASRRPRWQAAV